MGSKESQTEKLTRWYGKLADEFTALKVDFRDRIEELESGLNSSDTLFEDLRDRVIGKHEERLEVLESRDKSGHELVAALTNAVNHVLEVFKQVTRGDLASPESQKTLLEAVKVGSNTRTAEELTKEQISLTFEALRRYLCIPDKATRESACQAWIDGRLRNSEVAWAQKDVLKPFLCYDRYPECDEANLARMMANWHHNEHSKQK